MLLDNQSTWRVIPVTLQIMVEGKKYTFQGPRSPSQLPKKSGVYMVMGNGGQPVYVGEASNMHDRVVNGHERKTCWQQHGTGQRIRYVPIPHASVRKKVEARAISKWKPTCNK